MSSRGSTPTMPSGDAGGIAPAVDDTRIITAVDDTRYLGAVDDTSYLGTMVADTADEPGRRRIARHRRMPAPPPPPAVRVLPLPAGWPLVALLLLFPLWWALGLGVLIFPILAVPMAAELMRRRPIKSPPGFILWGLFLVVVVISFIALGINPPGTVHSTFANRLPGAMLRLVEYLSVTIIMLYAGNLTEKELPQRRLIRLLAWCFVFTVAGGLIGTFIPHLEFTSPVEYLLPSHIRSNSFVQSLVHPSASQEMHVLGYDTPRAAAPWGYTNVWGNCYFILVLWFVVAGWTHATRRWHRVVTVVVLAISAVPMIYSLNRGLWLALGLAAVYIAVRLAMRGRWMSIVAIGVAGVIGLGVLAYTPVGDMVTSRVQHGASNDVRVYTTQKALENIPDSPIIGFGSTRNTAGSDQSIAVGSTDTCQNCGEHTLGSNGQVWLELYAHGILGALLFFGMGLVGIWHYRRDRSAVGIVTSCVLLLNLFASGYYNTLIGPLVFTYLSYALVWRRHMIIDENRRAAANAVGPQIGPVRRRRSAALAGG
ncbi:MAG TPA: O-antigen ligase family protein [Micromonosporaceae bacterium]|nr:O-antigen ligase family protein [Micromonosporaceae bacterium]